MIQWWIQDVIPLMQEPFPPARLFTFKREKSSDSAPEQVARQLPLFKQKTLTANIFWNKLTSINIRIL